jgi:hypothetical protein
MFTALNKQGCRSEKGFVVQFAGPFEVEYREAGKTATLHPQAGRDANGAFIVSIRDDAFRWDGDDPATVIPEIERERLFVNLRDGMAFLGVTLVVSRAMTKTEVGVSLENRLRGGFLGGEQLNRQRLTSYSLRFRDAAGLEHVEPFAGKNDAAAKGRARELLLQHPGCKVVDGFVGAHHAFTIER